MCLSACSTLRLSIQSLSSTIKCHIIFTRKNSLKRKTTLQGLMAACTLDDRRTAELAAAASSLGDSQRPLSLRNEGENGDEVEAGAIASLDPFSGVCFR